MQWWPYVVPLALLFALFIFGQRKRRQQMVVEAERISQIAFGDDVMTTSGLYGTVVGRNDDDGTAQLAIAPGVEVTWALAALRDAKSLPDQYRKPLAGADDEAEPPDEADRTP
ncbi:MAG: preprotein translocase subunit YajC [Pseudonocardiales bacterium]